MKRLRQAARVLLLNPEERFLLFRFHYESGPLAGVEYWGVPGGGVEDGEAVEEAAARELFEETGLRVAPSMLGPVVAESAYEFRLSTGEEVRARDSYFLLRIGEGFVPSKEHYTPEETANMVEQRWWSLEELRASGETFIPEHIAEIVAPRLRMSDEILGESPQSSP